MMTGRSSQSYKKYTLILLIVTIAALVICAAAFSLKRKSTLAVQGTPEQTYSSHYIPKASASQESGGKALPSQVIPTLPRPSPSPTPSVRQESYWVTLKNGKIGIYQKGKEEPLLTAEIDASQLPKEDLSLLEQGIPAKSFSEARSILEDYE